MSSTVAFSDNFTRADNTDLGSNWDAGYSSAGFTNLQIISNRVRSTEATGRSGAESVNAIADMTDAWAQCTVSTITGAQGIVIWPFARAAAPSTVSWYEASAVRIFASSEIKKRIAGAETSLASESVTTWVAGDVLRLEVQGTALRLYRNGSLLLSATDGALASGRIGCAIYVDVGGSLANAELDDFQGGPMGDATVLAPRTRPFPFKPGASRR